MDGIDSERQRILGALGDALGAAALPPSLPQEQRQLVAGLRQLFGAAACSFARVEPTGDALRFVTADGAGAEEIIDVVLPVTRGLAGWVALSGEPIQVSDVATDPRFAKDVAEATDYVPHTILAAPVVDADGETLGVVEVLDPSAEGRDTSRDLATIGLFAAELATIVRLADRFDGLGRGLVNALRLSDSGTVGRTTGEGDETGLYELAVAFRSLAAAGPAATRRATTLLKDIAAYVEEPR